MTFANWAGDRFSRLRSSRSLMPYSGSPDLPRRPYLLPDGAAAHVPGGLDGELHDVEQVHRDPRAREHPADRRREDRAHVDGDDLRPRPARPAWRRPASTRRHQRCGPRPGRACPAPRTGRRSRCATGPRAARTPRSAVSVPPAGPAAAVLVDAQVRDRGRVLRPAPRPPRGERVMHGRPGDPGVPGRLRRGDPPVRDLGRGMLPQPAGDRAPRRHLRHPLGERRRGQAAAGHSIRRLTRKKSVSSPAGPDVARPGHHVLVHAVPATSRTQGTPPAA